MARRRRSGTKRTISAEQLAKMQAGKIRAREEREKTKERVEMLSDLDARLAEGRRNASQPVTGLKSRRRHVYAK